MKKFLFSVAALLCFSLSSFANEVADCINTPSTFNETVFKEDGCIEFDITISTVGDDPNPDDCDLAEITFTTYHFEFSWD